MKKFVIILLCCVISFFLGHLATIMLSEDTVQTETITIVEESAPEATTKPAEKEAPEKADNAKKQGPLSGKVICIDAGHGIASQKRQEQIAPNSSETKPAFASGTHGKNLTEEELNLIVALKLEKKLTGMGATVYMTRTTHETTMSNIDRAQFANEKNADISVKIHADGVDSPSAHGISMLVPGNKYIKNETLCAESKAAGTLILENVVKQTDAKNNGVVQRNDMTGFNWSKVPVVLLEMGFMTNPQEDAKLETEAYQDKIVTGIADGLLAYFK